MAKEEEDKDLGFFNNIKAELVPLIAGLVSFKLLADQAINQLGEYFGLNVHNSALLFIALYFIVPVLLIICWLIIFNYNEGLKKQFLTVNSFERWLVLTLLVLIVFLALGIRLLSNLHHSIVALCVFGLVIVYAVMLLLKKFLNKHLYQREYHQARYQFVLVIFFLVLVWGFYYHGLLNEKKPNGEKKDKTEQIHHSTPADTLVILIDTAQYYKKIDTDYEQKLDTLKKYFDAYQFSYLPDTALSFICKMYKRQFPDCYDCCPLLYVANDSEIAAQQEIIQQKAVEQQYLQLKYSFEQQRESNMDLFKSNWAQWLHLVQFKGLLLFVNTILFLLCIWYHAYTSQLENKSRRNPRRQGELYSEIAISRISIYILFLFTIIFFKPIDKEDVNFDKPFIASGINFSDNRQYHSTGIPEKPIEPEVKLVRVEVPATGTVTDTTKLGPFKKPIMDKIEELGKQMKKQINKAPVTYDDK